MYHSVPNRPHSRILVLYTGAGVQEERPADEWKHAVIIPDRCPRVKHQVRVLDIIWL